MLLRTLPYLIGDQSSTGYLASMGEGFVEGSCLCAAPLLDQLLSSARIPDVKAIFLEYLLMRPVGPSLDGCSELAALYRE